MHCSVIILLWVVTVAVAAETVDDGDNTYDNQTTATEGQ